MKTVEMSFESPVGELRLVARGNELVGVYFTDHVGAPPRGEVSSSPVLLRARTQLDEFFAGKRRSFDVPIAGDGTAFERSVWALLRQIPIGETTSYGALATKLGRPTAARAVARANARNPLSILVPCHRVIGKDGSLTGYAGGLPQKKWLLEHESRLAAEV